MIELKACVLAIYSRPYMAQKPAERIVARTGMRRFSSTFAQ